MISVVDSSRSHYDLVTTCSPFSLSLFLSISPITSHTVVALLMCDSSPAINYDHVTPSEVEVADARPEHVMDLRLSCKDGIYHRQDG